MSVRLNVIIENVAAASEQFLAELPMPQIPDPDNEGEMIDKYTVREHVELWLLKRLNSHCYQGRLKLIKQAQDAATPSGPLFSNESE